MMAQIQYFPNKLVMGNLVVETQNMLLIFTGFMLYILRDQSDRHGNHNAELTNVHKRQNANDLL